MGKRTREQYNEDLFKDTTMTIGEHLEELRTCLFKAVLGLAIGFLIDLLLAAPVVRAIEGPLTRALTKFQHDKSAENIRQRVTELREAGYPLPEPPLRAILKKSRSSTKKSNSSSRASPTRSSKGSTSILGTCWNN